MLYVQVTTLAIFGWIVFLNYSTYNERKNEKLTYQDVN